MTKDKSFELIKGVRVTEASDIDYNQGKRLDTTKYKQFDRGLNGATFPTQMFVDKLAKHYAFHVCESGIDAENKKVWFKNMINADKSEIKAISFDDAAKCFGWKSFTFSENWQTVIPKK